MCNLMKSLAYPNFSKPFELHTDVSKVQLGTVISQDNKLISFCSTKLILYRLIIQPQQENYYPL